MSRFFKIASNQYLNLTTITNVTKTETMFRKNPQLQVTYICPKFEGYKLGNFFDGFVTYQDKVDTYTYNDESNRDADYEFIKKHINKNIR